MHRSNTATPSRLLWLGLAVVAAFIIHLCLGSSEVLSLTQVLEAMTHGPRRGEYMSTLIWEIRLPRSCAALLVGTILGMVGAAFQSLFRNPLVEPYVIGVSGGAGVGGTLAVSIGWGMVGYGAATAGLALVGGCAALAAVKVLSSSGGGVSGNRLLVTGVVVGSFLGSMMTLILLMGGKDSTVILGWLLGSLTPMFWPKVAMLLVASIGCGIILIRGSRALNVLAVSEATAARLGVQPEKVANQVLIAGTAATSIAVGTSGLIGFLGMIAPHLARRVVGPDARFALPAAGLFGGALLLVSDTLAQRLVRSIELPVGAVTAVLGSILLFSMLKGAKL